MDDENDEHEPPHVKKKGPMEQVDIKIGDGSGEEEAVGAGQRRHDASILKRTLELPR